ncbi:MAG: glycine--tRNA ligase [Bdellovibrionales bacterium]|nr:glycine--tRNA ligase [Bdellovibrionales bacterium]
MKNQSLMTKLLALCRARGFLFPSSEIYGGLNSCWDYGPLGVQLKNNLKRAWWTDMTKRRNITGLDSSIIMHPKTWEASGHLEGFTDPLSDCKDCKNRFRLEDSCCPHCGSSNITKSRNFNLMFKTFMGPVEEDSSLVYLRPETAQGIFVNFLNVQKSMRLKIPFGIAQIGKAFRNEITPSHSIFRTREFGQMEMQFFTPPEESDKWFEYWREEREKQLLSLGLTFRWKDHSSKDLAHYSKKAGDIQFEFPWDWDELEGIHHRGDYDLSRHQKFSGKKLQYFCPEKKISYTPYVIETSIGTGRLFLALLCSAYKQEEERVVLKLSPHIAPVQIAILALSKKTDLIDLSQKIRVDLEKKYFVDYDDSGSIGKRYRRQDEIGTPFCVTIDFESLEDKKVTVRDRDTMKQERISIDSLPSFFLKSF